MSDKSYHGLREDLSGPIIEKMLPEDKFKLERSVLLPDEKSLLLQELIYMADELKLDLILTSGGTGFSPGDITPEASMEAADRSAPGIAEAIRAFSMKLTKAAMFSRGVSVIRKGSLIINLPGSPKAVQEILEYLLPVLDHGLEVLGGRASECASLREERGK